MAHDDPVVCLLEVAVKKLVLALIGVAGALALVKRQRDRELDEAIWEEPQDV